MEYINKCLIDDIAFCAIELAVNYEMKNSISYISIIKFIDNKMYEYNTRVNNNIEVVQEEVKRFLGDVDIISDRATFLSSFIMEHMPSIKNRVLDLMELAAILEPYHKEFSLFSLLENITYIKVEELKEYNHIENKIQIIILNALLYRLWRYEEGLKGPSFYNILVKEYNLEKRWAWTNYIEKPLFWHEESIKYIKDINDTFNEDKKLKPINIEYNKFSDLLREKDIWENGEDFNYEYREEQRKFSESIHENILANDRILIEAPTGSGKTFAYLLIVILEAYKNINKNRRADASFIISTDTKELQNQLINKDIPSMLSKLFLTGKIKYGAIKGKNNYICTDKLHVYKPINEGINKTLGEIFLKRLCKDGQYGDIEDISYFAYNHFNLKEVLNEVVCNNDECNLDRCRKKCYLRNRYLELPEENITVVNHSLLASWPYSEKKSITHLIIDEAHNLMDKCYDFFSEEFSSFEFNGILKKAIELEPSIYRQLAFLNAQNGYRENIDKDKIVYWISEIDKTINLFLSSSRKLNLVQDEYNFRCEYNLSEELIKEKVHKLQNIIIKLKSDIYGLYSLINRYFLNITLDGDDMKDNKEYSAISGYVLKLKNAYDTIDNFINNDENNTRYAKVLEISKDYSSFTFTNIPLNINELFNELLKDVKSTTFLSATLRINNSFSRIKGILGQENANELVVPPTFNLKKRTKIYTINDIGSYNSQEFIEKSAKFIIDIARQLNGHVLALFTNNIRLEGVYQTIENMLAGSDIEVFNSKKAIPYLKDKNRKIIILGSKGFFEGIDVPGDGLLAVILDKLPNKSIDDPLLKALVKYKNKNYKYVNYPQLCIKVKQVYGRLIRSVMDCGYFCILDGGKNKNTIWQLEKDLGGPNIINISSTKLIDRLYNDYYIWERANLVEIIKNIKGKLLFEEEFIIEANKRKSFWESTEKEYKNLNIRIPKK